MPAALRGARAMSAIRALRVVRIDLSVRLPDELFVLADDAEQRSSEGWGLNGSDGDAGDPCRGGRGESEKQTR